jgi:inosine-uridine nucleoside N-ribohydrolase
MKRIEKKPFEKIRQKPLEWPRYTPCDEFAMAVVINESAIVQESEEVYATVEVKGEYTYGMMVIDWFKILRKPSNVKIVTKVDQKEFFKMLCQCVGWK